jgi:hypothetical protein
MIVGAVVAVGIFAGLDTLRSSGGEPRLHPAEGDRAVTTTPTGPSVESSSALWTDQRPLELTSGPVSTDENASRRQNPTAPTSTTYWG